MITLFEQWLDETRKLQEEAYHADYDHFASAPNAPPDLIVNLIEYISMNVTATFHELVELQSETSWKPWQMDAPYVNRDQIRGEAVDALHFIANILVAIGVSDEELNRAYLGKMRVNRKRQLGDDGYYVRALGVKCWRCKRALDDVDAAENDKSLCQQCDQEMLSRA